MFDLLITLVFSVVVGITAFVAAYLFVIKSSTARKNSSKGGSIPGWNQKPADPGMGDLIEVQKHGSLHEYLLHLHQNGHQPIAAFWWGQQRVVSICSPDLIKDTIKLTNKPRELMKLFEPVTGPETIGYTNGEEWEGRRKWVYDPLKGTPLESYMPTFVKIANETVTTWSQFVGDDNIVDLEEEFLTMTLKGITRTCYGSIFSEEKEVRKMSSVYHKMWNEMEQVLRIGPPIPGSDRDKMFKDYAQQLRDVIREVVRKRQSEEVQESVPFLDSLLQSGVPDEQIIADGIAFLVGGLHTVAYLLYWTVHYLMLNKDIYHKLVAEMQEQVGSDREHRLKKYISGQSTLLRQVLNEVLRLTTLITYAIRYSDDDMHIGQYHIPAGTSIIIAMGVCHKNETIWENVEQFDHTQCSHLQGKDILAFAPFGHGRRRCPGYHFAHMEVSVFLTILLQKFTIKPVGEAKDVEKVHGLVTTPKKALKCQVFATNN